MATNEVTSNGSENHSLEWKDVSIDIGWGVMRGKQYGTGSRRILGLHGWLDNANTFDLIAPSLPNDSTLISLDLPGHGQSDHFPEGFIYDPRGYVGAIKKTVMALGWEDFIYLGHSMGAVVGIMYAAIFPNDVTGFISIDIVKPWSYPSEQYPGKFNKYFNSYFDNEKKYKQEPLVYSKEELIKKTIEGSKSLDESTAEILLERGAKKSDKKDGYVLCRDLRAKTYFIGFLSFEGWISMAENIKCPQLFIKAMDGHSYESAENYEKMLDSFKKDSPLFEYIELPGKHHVHMTHPNAVVTHINKFLNNVKLTSTVNNAV